MLPHGLSAVPDWEVKLVMIMRIGLLATVVGLMAMPLTGIATHNLYQEQTSGIVVVANEWSESWTATQTPLTGPPLTGDDDEAHKYLIFNGQRDIDILATTSTFGSIVRINAFEHNTVRSDGTPEHPDRYSRCPQQTVSGATTNPSGTVGRTLSTTSASITGVQNVGLRLPPGTWIVYVDGVLSPGSTTITTQVKTAGVNQPETFTLQKLEEQVNVIVQFEGVGAGIDFGACNLGVLDPFGGSGPAIPIRDLVETALPE